MAEFLARVELHRATEDEYEGLHVQMGLFGFARAVPATTGGRYQLPTGTYWIESDFDAQAVLGFAQSAVNVTGRSSSIIVAQSAEAWFGGLPKVE